MDELSRTLVKWDKSFATGVDTIDQQHQVLFELIGRLQRAMLEGRGRDGLPEIVDSLVKYADYHFAWEEQMLVKEAYPDLEMHLKAHRVLKDQVYEFQKNIAEGKLQPGPPVMLFLRHWLSDHVKGTDLRYARYLKEKDSVPEAKPVCPEDSKQPS